MSDKPSFAVGEVRRPSGRRGAGPVGTGVFRVFDLRPGAGMIDYLFLGADTSREGAERAAAAFTRIFERSGEVAIERHLRRCMRYCDLRALIVEMAKFTTDGRDGGDAIVDEHMALARIELRLAADELLFTIRREEDDEHSIQHWLHPQASAATGETPQGGDR